ncbi:MAG: hypothetical protein E7G36_05785 [Peptoniphilus rhinitidis]|jgi:MaoC family protein|uniref:hypothetical protein n=1 Tax=Peptoniphilus TaxID=162289 RepID=UPI0002880D88|nr:MULTISPECIES: hypothetical protein [Peptoniphilus]MDU1953950.1 hypothetical protein [Peptoniphilus lacydonensis]MDU2110182.1 hypothetical protein [Peptoniphilus lacydonensis]MDU2115188.1 hypothetical protein [Peptoniphilus lacydonensis]MDU3751216.1 hypothetical protein [Peptoniphilus rhinitidis]MDU5275103.1 hypothetical protein [Peptoniphilus lacydonensis]
MKLNKDDEVIYERIFTEKDVYDYAKNANFWGKHHKGPNEKGEYLLQGLLTASLTNKIGGDYDILMYKMEFDFLKKAYTGRKIKSINVVDNIENKKDRNFIDITSDVYDENGDHLLHGILRGILLD